MEFITSSEVQSHCVLALAGLSSAYVTIARPKLVWHKGESHYSPPATLYEAGTSPFISTRALALYRAVLALYIFAMGGAQVARVGTYPFKFYTIWNWWLLGLYFALATVASLLCSRAERTAGHSGSGAAAQKALGGSGANGTGVAASSDAAVTGGAAAAAPDPAAGGEAGLQRPTALSRTCHAIFLVNSATVIIVDVVCWAVLYPMLKRGPQTPEIERIIKRLLLSFTSYNQHGFNAVFIFVDLFLNRQRLAFHAVGALGLWSLLYGLWAHTWHAMSGKWLYPFLDISKPWAPLAYLGLYLVHWGAFGLVALLYRAKAAALARWGPKPAAGAGMGAGKDAKTE